ncbi:MAG: hypothetical protein HZC55_16015 [Verrucomicrobia bacterium]|nr:hypothetical protein [Verrucomicrobiota bacterium]
MRRRSRRAGNFPRDRACFTVRAARQSRLLAIPSLPLATDAFILAKRPSSDAFQGFSAFSPSQGLLLILQRLSRKSAASATPLDLFDEVALLLESPNQGQTWFVKEARLVQRSAGIGTSYETLRLASALANLIVRNPVPEESRPAVAGLLRTAFAAFASDPRPDIVYFKSLYRFARDEGYPLKQHWFPTLPAADRATVAALVNQPLAGQTAPAAEVTRLLRRLEEYLRGHSEILLE